MNNYNSDYINNIYGITLDQFGTKRFIKNYYNLKGSNTPILQTNQEQQGEAVTQPVSNTNCHMLSYESSASGKTSFLKYYLSRVAELRKSSFVMFGRDEEEFPASNFVPLLQLEKIGIESLANKTVKLDDAGAYKSLKTKVEDLLRFGRHHNIQVIYLAYYAKDVLPIVRENCFKIFLTINTPDNIFETMIQTYSIKDGVTQSKW